MTKDIGDTYPEFKIERFGSANGSHFFTVSVDGEFIGTLVKKSVASPGSEWPEEKWFIGFVAGRSMHTYVPIANQEEGAQILWQEHEGKIQIPELPQQHDPLVPPPDDPDHYESIRQKAAALVNLIVENDDVEVAETFHEFDPAVDALTRAGFRVENKSNSMTVSWPAESMNVLHSGVTRVKQILESALPSKYIGHVARNNRTASMIVTKI